MRIAVTAGERIGVADAPVEDGRAPGDEHDAVAGIRHTDEIT